MSITLTENTFFPNI